MHTYVRPSIRTNKQTNTCNVYVYIRPQCVRSAGGQPLVVSLALDAELPAAALAAMSCVFSDGSRPGFNVIFAQATAAADGKSVRAGG